MFNHYNLIEVIDLRSFCYQIILLILHHIIKHHQIIIVEASIYLYYQVQLIVINFSLSLIEFK